ncbi:MAG TPA: hypothetical protein PKY61_01150 [bacterium]|nr:hypothetical protein [bacterium]HQO11288.1 hypothetical protein [bacterium]HQQ38581.1 hypothetical protein [bacterium]
MSKKEASSFGEVDSNLMKGMKTKRLDSSQVASHKNRGYDCDVWDDAGRARCLNAPLHQPAYRPH